MNTDAATVFVVDDDIDIRNSLRSLIESVGLTVETYVHATEFLERYEPHRPGCLILDMRMPGMSGRELQQQLREREIVLPIIFISAHGDIPLAVEAIRDGAVDFIEKPFRAQALLDRIAEAIQLDARRRAEQASRAARHATLAQLTQREREVVDLLVAGNSIKQIAQTLNISPKTVQIHRANAMTKTESGSVVELVKLCAGGPMATVTA